MANPKFPETEQQCGYRTFHTCKGCMQCGGSWILIDFSPLDPSPEAEFKEKHGSMGPDAIVDNNFTLSRLQSRLQHIYHGQPYARVDLNPMQESTLSSSQGLRIWPLIQEGINDPQKKNSEEFHILKN